MRAAPLMIIVAAMALAPWVGARAQNNGLSTMGQNAVWPQWQGRLAFGLSHPLNWPAAEGLSHSNAQPSSLSLLGDYYFYRTAPAPSAARASMGGFRATSGILLGGTSPRLLSAWGGASLGSTRFSLSRQPLGADNGTKDDDAATPYLGLGYTSISLGGGWGFSADIGLSTSNSRSGTQLGRNAASSANQNLEDMLRDMRLAPLMHLGVSYSF